MVNSRLSQFRRWREQRSRRVFEVSLALSLLLACGLFYAFKRFPQPEPRAPHLPSMPPITIDELPPIVKETPPPAPRRPTIDPIYEAGQEELPPDLELPLDSPSFEDESLNAQEGDPIFSNDEVVRLQMIPRVVRRVKPEYPPLARRLQLEGLVVVKVLVGKRGDVERAEVLKSTNPMFEKAALKAARRMKFTPGIWNSLPVRVWMIVPFRFKLKQ
ncbi:MAG: energy transducer TonB [Calditrichaeota bacterium]|nr:MAG: energy transducer TonB [Calditrichota bacterium]